MTDQLISRLEIGLEGGGGGNVQLYKSIFMGSWRVHAMGV